MKTELYNRQESLKLKRVPFAVIVGCGGTGSWVALFLALSGCENLDLMDSDRLETSNFNRLPLEIDANVDRNKAEAIKDLVEKLRPDCIATTYARATDYTLSLTLGEILFDCTDNQDTQVFLCKWAREHGRQYIRVGYNGTHVTVTDKSSSWRTTATATTGYTIQPSWAVPAALAACLGVSKAMFAPATEASLDLKDFSFNTFINKPAPIESIDIQPVLTDLIPYTPDPEDEEDMDDDDNDEETEDED